MTFNYGAEKRKFEKAWSKLAKSYAEAGMESEAIKAMYKATAYIRLSYTDDRSSESDSVSNQRKLIENFVERNPDIEVVSFKVDDGYSGIIFAGVR